jgi:hypothetical protein
MGYEGRAGMYSDDFFERRFGAPGIDHEGRRAGRDGSAIGTRNRHTTPEMRAA